MEPDKIYNEISQLPPEAQQEVANFISFLKTRYQKQQKPPLQNDILRDPFIGIWKDREDMKDGKWLRKVRASEWGASD
jgi:hypothetical protein